jgi:hypothetical protein
LKIVHRFKIDTLNSQTRHTYTPPPILYVHDYSHSWFGTGISIECTCFPSMSHFLFLWYCWFRGIVLTYRIWGKNCSSFENNQNIFTCGKDISNKSGETFFLISFSDNYHQEFYTEDSYQLPPACIFLTGLLNFLPRGFLSNWYPCVVIVKTIKNFIEYKIKMKKLNI